MNFALSDEQEFLKEAARGALSRVKTVEAAREALDGAALPDLWPAAVEAGWPGLLVSDEHGGAGLSTLEAMLVFEELGRVLAGVPLLGHLPATFLLDRAGAADAAGSARRRRDARRVRPGAAADRPERRLDRRAAVRHDARGRPVVRRRHRHRARSRGCRTRPAPTSSWSRSTTAAPRWSAARTPRSSARTPTTRPARSATCTFDAAPATLLDVGPADVAAAWYIAQALIGAESLGAVDVALQFSVAYAKERHTFGRPIGSYQAVKHELVEILRGLDNARSLMYYAGWAAQDKPDEFALAASAFRLAAGKAFDHAARAQISVHGGIGATWEHDAPLYFRRAQLSRRLLGGTAGAADRVAGELLTTARAQAAAA